MRAVLQRVSRARVTVEGETTGEIGKGILVLLGVSVRDTETDAVYLLDKTVNLRMFDDSEGRPNISLVDIGGGLLVVSQFTLYADTQKGRRPSYLEAADAEAANRLYQFFVVEARKLIGNVQTGRFQAMMNVELVNHGPVTIILDTEKTN